jgi:soluble lytic murein transglycosylase-like protein
MSISFIQQRISELDSYLRNLDVKKQQVFAQDPGAATQTAKSSFDDALEEALGTESSKSVKAEKINPDSYSKLPDNFEEYIDSVTAELSAEHSVDLSPNLVKSVIKQESGFNPNATSGAGAQGLMQLMPATARSVGVFNSMNPYQNVRGGITYLAQMMKRFDGNIQKSLAAYNAGPAAIEKYGGIPPYRETQNYVQSIMKDYLRREDYRPVDMTA